MMEQIAEVTGLTGLSGIQMMKSWRKWYFTFGSRLNANDQLTSPVIGALENDISCIYCYGGSNNDMPLPMSSATALVDASIDLFSRIVFEQPLKIQESAFAQIAACLGES